MTPVGTRILNDYTAFALLNDHPIARLRRAYLFATVPVELEEIDNARLALAAVTTRNNGDTVWRSTPQRAATPRPLDH